MDDVVEIIRERIEGKRPDLYFIRNCDVMLLILEIDRLRAKEPGGDGYMTSMTAVGPDC